MDESPCLHMYINILLQAVDIGVQSDEWYLPPVTLKKLNVTVVYLHYCFNESIIVSLH